MRATIMRWGRGLAALIALAMLIACSIGREPAYDAALAGEVTSLTAGTLRLMAQGRGSAVAPGGLIMRLAQFGGRLPQAGETAPNAAERLAEYADATTAYMEDYLRNLTALEAHDREATGGGAERIAAYQAALAAHETAMLAYLDAFRRWHAGAGPSPEQPAPPPQAPALGLDPIQVALRRTALEDIPRDALSYERDILHRNR